MNNFCNNCIHRTIPNILKEKFNDYVNKFWYECPMNDKEIFGCTLKYLSIGWVEFYKHLIKEGILKEDEKKFLEKSGWNISD